MNISAQFIEFTQENLSIFEYSAQFCQLAVKTDFNDETLNSLYWTRANYYSSLELPNMEKGTWREAILRCLQCAYSQLMPALTATAEPEYSPTA